MASSARRKWPKWMGSNVPPKRPSGSGNFGNAENVAIAGVETGKDDRRDDQAHQRHDDDRDKPLGSGKQNQEQAEQKAGNDAGEKKQADAENQEGPPVNPA